MAFTCTLATNGPNDVWFRSLSAALESDDTFKLSECVGCMVTVELLDAYKKVIEDYVVTFVRALCADQTTQIPNIIKYLREFPDWKNYILCHVNINAMLAIFDGDVVLCNREITMIQNKNRSLYLEIMKRLNCAKIKLARRRKIMITSEGARCVID